MSRIRTAPHFTALINISRGSAIERFTVPLEIITSLIILISIT